MKKSILVEITEIAAFIFSAIFACLWIYNPSGPYEPIVAAAGIVGFAAELLRRYGLRNPITAPPLAKGEVANLARSVHEITFRSLRQKIKDTSRIVRAKGRYNSSFGMKEVGSVFSSTVSAFLEEFERRVAKVGVEEANAVAEILSALSSEDTQHAAAMLEEHFPTRVGSVYLNDVINATIENITNQYKDAADRQMFERRTCPMSPESEADDIEQERD